MKQSLPLFLLLLIASLAAKSQVICGADILHNYKIKTDSVYAKAAAATEIQLNKAVQTRKAASIISSYYNMVAAVYTIPVVVHVLNTGGAPGTAYNPSSATIQGAIDYLNSVYDGTSPGNEGAGDIGIQFVLATRDPANNPTTGIDRVNLGANATYVTYGIRLQTSNGLSEGQIKNLTRWDPGLYYNIYIVNKIDGEDGTSGVPFVAGFAQYPSVSVGSDGTVMLANQMLSGAKTLPHEIGHALGLAHPFEGATSGTPPASCPSNADCNINGDQICDTDPIVQPAFVARTGTNPCTGTPFNSYTEHNFMNYTDVFTLFTPMQKDRMVASMTLPFRASLASSWARVATYPYSFTAASAACVSNSDAFGMSAGYAGLLGVNVGNRRFSSGITATDPGYVNKSASPLHLIPLDTGVTYPLSTDLFAANDQQVAVYIDFNNNGSFLDAGERILYIDSVPAIAQIMRVSGTFTVPGTVAKNVVFRMRVIEELASNYGTKINGPCYQPYFGQTEDFPVIVTSAIILPVSWKYFKGQKTGNDVLLLWATASENKNKQFEVERSVDGVNYLKIGMVPASAAGKEYSYTDHDAMLPLYYYRLKQIDNNGKQTMSSVIIVRNDQQTEDQNVRVTNPFTNKLDISLSKPFATSSSVQLIDLNGRTVAGQILPAGQTSLIIDVTGKQLSSGIYLLKIINGDNVITKKLVR